MDHDQKREMGIEDDVDFKKEIVNTKREILDIHKDDENFLEKDVGFSDLPEEVRSEAILLLRRTKFVLLRKRQCCY